MRNPAPLPAELQSGTFTRRRALELGVPEHRFRARDIIRLGHGIYRHAAQRDFPALPPATSDDLLGDVSLLSSLHEQSPDLWFSHTTAAQLWGLELPRYAVRTPKIHITREESSTSVSRLSGLEAHAAVIEPGEVVWHRGLRLSSPARTFFDLMHVLSEKDLVALGDQLVRQPRPEWEQRAEPFETPASLLALLSSHRKTKGIVRGRRAATQVRIGSDSRMETYLRLCLLAAGLPEPSLQIRPSPESPYTGDLGYPERRIVIHYDGSSHFTAEQQAKDQRRNYSFEKEGWVVLIANSEDWRDRFTLFTRRVGLLLRQSGR